MPKQQFVSSVETEKLAFQCLEKYINECKCASPSDVSRALQKMIVVSRITLDVLEKGEKTVLQ
ncbi:hypothetical protein [Plesiomonas shigelloides]|uniref:hypothetical protein n=1 Tax=Plesiomonas shigelloides TaxID=703 RepID=UPI0012621DA5|nr:hypothetical protein [Plesiomonas shigelloides]KAB7678707.1 hypothetical protein GBN16_05460 [Plesiomonas shigelloides]